MGFLNRLFGGEENEEKQQQDSRSQSAQPLDNAAQSEDERAIARYRYMLKTAPPETIEQAHAEAFAQLTPQQRQMVLQKLSRELPETERRNIQPAADDPQALARLATRAEVRQPGTIERVFGGFSGGYGGVGGASGGFGFGGMIAGSFLSSLAGTVIGSYIAQEFFNHDSNFYSDNLGNFGEYNANDQNALSNDFAPTDEYQSASDYSDYSADETSADNFSNVSDSFSEISDDFGGDFGGE